tara:strand:- start:479 stop:658 length:180 start_codon:yes stop_codon:yes gene_type:complete
MIKITIILVFVLVLFSSCSKNVENCKIKPKVDVEMTKNSESDKKSVNLEQTEAEISCNF